MMGEPAEAGSTLHGWLKSINHPSLNISDDPALDGGPNTMGRDLWAMGLTYYEGDFKNSNTRFTSSNYAFRPAVENRNLYNGNISSWTSNTLPSQATTGTQFAQLTANQYIYDRLNRIKESRFSYYQQSAWSSTEQYKTKYSYDGNGNLQTLMRNTHVLNNLKMDDLQYAYYPNSNKLRHVKDAVPAANWDTDVDNQPDNNYQYDPIGNLTKDIEGEVSNIQWTVYGKVNSVTKLNGSKTAFLYDAAGNRVSKAVTTLQGIENTWYVRDASGNIMATYVKNSNTAGKIVLEEQPIYGSDRLGIRRARVTSGMNHTGEAQYLNADITLTSYANESYLFAPGVEVTVADGFEFKGNTEAEFFILEGVRENAPDVYTRILGRKHYELKDHLGNVSVVFADKKISGQGAYVPEMISFSNYYPFGLEMPGRYNTPSTPYRYGYNGKEKDTQGEFGKLTSYDYGFRIYNPGIAKFLSVDPLTKDYPWSSPYAFAANNPIRYIDIEGMGPGDPFKTPDEAAKDFGKTYNDNSIGATKEYATTIIKVTTAKGIYYTYVQPSIGTEASSRPSTRGLSGQETVARAHTHGSYSPKYDNEVFSPADITNATNQNVDSYVATPGGTLKKFEVATGNISTIATDIPSDPNSPANERVNQIDPVPLPKNEPTYGVWEFIKHNILNPIGQGAGAIYNKAPASNSQGSSTPSAPSTNAGSTGGSCDDKCQ